MSTGNGTPAKKLVRTWPAQVDFQDALQNPANSFLDPELQAATAADLTPFGLPAPITGQFANVYRFRLANGSLCAVRLFIGAGSESRRERYRMIERFLASLSGRPAAFVPFVYQEEGIRAGDGGYYPLIRMEWINGLALNAFVDAHLYEAAVILETAERFRELIASLDAAKITHGDLQHGNLLVESETSALRLIDYDGLYIPGMVIGETGELGHPSYQHPRRRLRDHGPGLDRFSALVIYVALRVLVVAPNVWFRLDNGDNMLFRRTDFERPGDSPAFDILREALLRSPAERRLVEILQRACQMPISTVPAIEDIVRRDIAAS